MTFASSSGFRAGLLRVALAAAVLLASIALWTPTAVPAMAAGQETVLAGHGPVPHGGMTDGSSEAPRHTLACLVVCTSGGADLSGPGISPLWRTIRSDAWPGPDAMRSGQTPDPALRPPKIEALS